MPEFMPRCHILHRIGEAHYLRDLDTRITRQILRKSDSSEDRPEHHSECVAVRLRPSFAMMLLKTLKARSRSQTGYDRTIEHPQS